MSRARRGSRTSGNLPLAYAVGRKSPAGYLSDGRPRISSANTARSSPTPYPTTRTAPSLTSHDPQLQRITEATYDQWPDLGTDSGYIVGLSLLSIAFGCSLALQGDRWHLLGATGGSAMSDVVYTTVPGKIPTLLSKIKQVGVPPKVTPMLGSRPLASHPATTDL